MTVDAGLVGGNYVIDNRGCFTLRDGQIAAVEGKPVLVVSDLDDTMIGDDDATAVFKRFWDTMVRFKMTPAASAAARARMSRHDQPELSTMHRQLLADHE